METNFARYHRRPEGPGLLFSEDSTCGALRAEVLGGRGEAGLDGRSLVLVMIEGSGKAWDEELFVEDMLFVPAGRDGKLEYDINGRALLVRAGPAGDEREPIRGHAVIRVGQAMGYVRTQYRGTDHGRGEAVRGFNPKGIVYIDKLWGISRDFLAQELVMPPGHVVPVHQHGDLGAEASGEDFWQLYYVWEGSARVDMGTSPRDRVSVELRPDSVLVYPNGVAHNVIAGAGGCRYLFIERRKSGGRLHLLMDEERDYERRLTLRGAMGLEEFLRSERARRG